MNRRRFLASSLLVYAGTSFGADDYPRVTAGHGLHFPVDHGSHPAWRTEWWYITGWLKDSSGSAMGMQVTFFRNRPRIAEDNPSRFAPRQLLFAHAAIADPHRGRLMHDQRAARTGFGLADAAQDAMDVRIGGWSLSQRGSGYEARIEARDFGFDLALMPTQDVLLQGEQGFSRKGPDIAQASYYYSWPHLAVSGAVTLGGSSRTVSGAAWLDHEWSSEMLATDAIGWDWTGINLHDGSALMAFRIRQRSGAALWAGGTLRTPDAKTRVFATDEVRFVERRRWSSPRTGVTYPIAMALNAAGVSYELQPLMDDQELDARASTGTVYWEGAVRALAEGREVGRGYLELTGYGEPLKLQGQ